MAFSGCSDVSYLSQILGLSGWFCFGCVHAMGTKVIIVLVRVTNLSRMI